MTGAMIMPVIPFTFYNVDGQPFGNDQSTNNGHSDTTHGTSHLSDDANFNSNGYGFDTVTHHQDGFNHSSFTETAYQDHTAYSSTHENSWESNSFHSTPEVTPNNFFDSGDLTSNSLSQDNDTFSNAFSDLLHSSLDPNHPSDTHHHFDSSTAHSHHSVLHDSYSSMSGSSDNHKPQISITDDVIYRHNLDGSATKVGYVTHDSDGHNIYDCDSNGHKNHVVCNINLNGDIHASTYHFTDYMGHVTNGKIYSKNNNVIGRCDSNMEGAAHLFFVGN